jgi:hypothetical protein
MAPLSKSASAPGIMKLGTGENFFRSSQGLAKKKKGLAPMDSERFKQLSEMVKTGFPVRSAVVDPDYRHKTKLDIEEDRIAGTHIPKNMTHPRNSPAWLKHDKQVLRFYAHFQESVAERPDENSRFRHVEIMYHMEDGSMQITEPKIENSGIPQGQFLKRHRCPKDDGMGFLGPDDLRCGQEVTIYRRTYYVSGCDRFTRWFFEENGVDVGEDEPQVDDHWSKSYKFKKLAEKGSLPMSRSAYEAKQLTKYQVGQSIADKKFTQFLLNDRKVLRFKAFWDDTTLYGARVYFVIHYYLADNTLEINEAHCRNSGRDNYPVFMRRSPLYKAGGGNVPIPGMLAPDPVPYLPEDFRVGESINVWNRKIVLYDCDDFTDSFYKEFLGVDQKAGQIDVSEKPVRHRKLHPPPHNGIGQEEDSIGNVNAIRPKQRKVDLVKLMTLSGEVCRFEARMANMEPEDVMRKFIIAYYPADDEVSVFELESRNSGHKAGKFAEKRRMRNPDTGRYFELKDFYIGCTVKVASQPFNIVRADEHCLTYLEARPDEFPYADPRQCALKLAPLADERQMQDEGGVDPDLVADLAAQKGVGLLDHEMVTLLRFFDMGGEEPKILGPAVLEVLKQAGAA